MLGDTLCPCRVHRAGIAPRERRGWSPEHLLSEGTHEFYAKCLVVFVAFIPFFAFKELGRVLGKGNHLGTIFPAGAGAAAKPGAELDHLQGVQPTLARRMVRPSLSGSSKGHHR